MTAGRYAPLLYLTRATLNDASFVWRNWPYATIKKTFSYFKFVTVQTYILVHRRINAFQPCHKRKAVSTCCFLFHLPLIGIQLLWAIVSITSFHSGYPCRQAAETTALLPQIKPILCCSSWAWQGILPWVATDIQYLSSLSLFLKCKNSVLSMWSLHVQQWFVVWGSLSIRMLIILENDEVSFVTHLIWCGFASGLKW